VAEALEQRLRPLQARGIQRIDQVEGKDRELLEYALLFRCYHRFNAPFDQLIEQQMKLGDKPAPVSFAHELLEELAGYGINNGDALKYMSLFYQLRRAFHFIDHALVGQSPAMKRLRHGLWNNVFTNDIRIYGHHLWGKMEDFSTLLLGETGTGKGTAAAAIGRSGPIPFDPRTGQFSFSFSQSFLTTNLSQFPESLIESELFGHRKGAFTGAIEHHQGIFERCTAHGTLFLDEIGDVTLPTQLKLLNILQERLFTPVGSHKALRFEGRVIAATNQSLDRLRQEGRFRDDFYYRLCSDVITVPSLQTRLQEMPDELDRLVRLLVERMTGRQDDSLAEKVLNILGEQVPRTYPWPGNVRELEQAIRRILLSGSYIPQTITHKEGAEFESIKRGEMTLEQLTRLYCRMLYQQHGTYEEVARRTGLDRRTAKKYVT
jgi:DNA-binding NtrC family response regulator